MNESKKQYQMDVESGYEQPWKLYKYRKSVDRPWREFDFAILSCDFLSFEIARLPNADELILEWQRKKYAEDCEWHPRPLEMWQVYNKNIQAWEDYSEGEEMSFFECFRYRRRPDAPGKCCELCKHFSGHHVKQYCKLNGKDMFFYDYSKSPDWCPLDAEANQKDKKEIIMKAGDLVVITQNKRNGDRSFSQDIWKIKEINNTHVMIQRYGKEHICDNSLIQIDEYDFSPADPFIVPEPDKCSTCRHEYEAKPKTIHVEADLPEPIQIMPKNRQEYVYIDLHYPRIQQTRWDDCLWERSAFYAGLCYRTEADAQAWLDFFKQWRNNK